MGDAFMFGEDWEYRLDLWEKIGSKLSIRGYNLFSLWGKLLLTKYI